MITLISDTMNVNKIEKGDYVRSILISYKNSWKILNL